MNMNQEGCQNKYPLLIAFGNPILDMTCKIKTAEIFHKYNLKPNQQYEKTTKEIENIKNDALLETGGEISINPGGSCLNSLRILGQLLDPNQSVMFCGAIGKDENGDKLTTLLKKSNIQVRLEVVSKSPTSNCLCLIWNENACLIADIAAALFYNLGHIRNNNLELYLLNSSIIYVEGFFIPNRFPVCEYLLKEICKKNEIMLIMNLSAPYICKEFQKECQTLSENADTVFGNAEQYLELGKAYKLTDLKNIAEELLKTYKLTKKKCVNFKNKLVVVTDGPNPVQIFYISNNRINHETYTVPKITKENLVDTTGAGDAFVAGFMSAFLRGFTPLECAQFGTHVAADTIKNVGVHLSSAFINCQMKSY